jgi:hypothetical protein
LHLNCDHTGGPLDQALAVDLTRSDTIELTVLASAAIPAGEASAGSAVSAPDGKALIGLGSTVSGATWAVARTTANGSFDTTFARRTTDCRDFFG